MKTIADLVAHVVSECFPVDREARFDDMLDECYSFEKVGGPFEHMLPSAVLKECDPTAYRCGVNDYADGESWTEVEGDMYQDSDIEAARAEFVSELEDDLSELEDEAEADEDAMGDDEREDLAAKITALKAFIVECEKYTF